MPFSQTARLSLLIQHWRRKTAPKWWSRMLQSRPPRPSAIAIRSALYASPPTETFVQTVASRSLWSELQQRLLPEEKWFGLIDRYGRLAAQSGADITTGSLPSRNAAGQPKSR